MPKKDLKTAIEEALAKGNYGKKKPKPGNKK